MAYFDMWRVPHGTHSLLETASVLPLGCDGIFCSKTTAGEIPLYCSGAHYVFALAPAKHGRQGAGEGFFAGCVPLERRLMRIRSKFFGHSSAPYLQQARGGPEGIPVVTNGGLVLGPGTEAKGPRGRCSLVLFQREQAQLWDRRR